MLSKTITGYVLTGTLAVGAVHVRWPFNDEHRRWRMKSFKSRGGKYEED